MSDKITSTFARESNGNIQITFTIPFEIVKKAQDETIAEMAKDIEIPGFRKGMAPLSKVSEKIEKGHLIEHSLSHILPKALADSVEENKLKIAIYPKFELIKAKENEAWEIKAVTCELPEINLGDYKKEITGILRADSLIIPGKDKGEESHSAEASRDKKEAKVIEAVLKNVEVKIPQILIEEEADSRLASLLARLEKLGLALENYLASIGKKPEDIRAEYANQAREAISLDLILSKIAEEEKIEVPESEIEEAIKVGQIKDESPERKRLITSILKRRKALDFLVNLA